MLGTSCKILATLSVAFLALPSAWAQSTKGLTARELFYSPPPAAGPSKAKETKPPAAPLKAAKKATKSVPASPKADTQTTPPPVASASPAAATIGGDAYLVQTSGAPRVPLGVRYSILKYDASDEYEVVDPDLVFRSGDRIRLRLQVNDSGFLYVVTQGSSGNWSLLFPSQEYDSGDNRVHPGRQYDIPGRTRWVFDEQPGTEKVFLVLSRRPEPDLDKLIYQLDAGKPAAPAPEAPKRPEPIKTLMAMNSVSDDLVGKIRSQVLARDLVFEKVSDDKPATRRKQPAQEPEKAVYVVNPDRSDDSRLVVDISLKHR